MNGKMKMWYLIFYELMQRLSAIEQLLWFKGVDGPCKQMKDIPFLLNEMVHRYEARKWTGDLIYPTRPK